MDDLTDALRAIIEPMRGELVSTAQAHYLASIREELADVHRHTERAMELISELIPEGTEPHWNNRPEYGVPYSISGWIPEKDQRRKPQAGEIWRFRDLSSKEEFLAMITTSTTNGNPEMARRRDGTVFKFNSVADPMPVAKMTASLRKESDPYPEPEPGSARERMMDGTDTY